MIVTQKAVSFLVVEMKEVLLVFICFVAFVSTEPLSKKAQELVLSHHNSYRKSLAEGKEINADKELMPTGVNMTDLVSMILFYS